MAALFSGPRRRDARFGSTFSVLLVALPLRNFCHEARQGSQERLGSADGYVFLVVPRALYSDQAVFICAALWRSLSPKNRAAAHAPMSNRSSAPSTDLKPTLAYRRKGLASFNLLGRSYSGTK